MLLILLNKVNDENTLVTPTHAPSSPCPAPVVRRPEVRRKKAIFSVAFVSHLLNLLMLPVPPGRSDGGDSNRLVAVGAVFLLERVLELERS